MDLEALLRMLNQPQQTTGQQSYMSMMGGGHFGGVIPQGTGQPVFSPPAQQEQPQQNKMSFGSSPWPGVWGGL